MLPKDPRLVLHLKKPLKEHQLELKFHGKVIEHLGIQMYQSPVNAIAEMVANAWDADSPEVDVDLPASLGPNDEIVITDRGVGMTKAECQTRYLHVGYNRREADKSDKTPEGRSFMGRKGIGKFAGFGIAKVLTVDTTSKKTGERTVFQLSLDELVEDRGEYVSTSIKPVPVYIYDGPNEARKANHGTRIILSRLKLKQVPSRSVIGRGLALRFIVPTAQAGFRITVNKEDLPEALNQAAVQYVFPRDYERSERPAALREVDEDGWGSEALSNQRMIRWRFIFMRDPLEDEELRGVTVYAHSKLAQKPTFFSLVGGTTGQHGMQYIFGQVVADYVDELAEDVIATERQRLNFEQEELVPLGQWGRDRIRTLLDLWQQRRGAQRAKQLELKVAGFSERLEKLPSKERDVVKSALRKLGSIASLSQEQSTPSGLRS